MTTSVFRDAMPHDQSVMWLFEYLDEDNEVSIEMIADVDIGDMRTRYFRATTVAYTFETKELKPVLIFQKHKTVTAVVSKIYKDMKMEFPSAKLSFHGELQYLEFQDEADQVMFKLKYFA
jgi:hypothetical protein